jgi:hypothetical protein
LATVAASWLLFNVMSPAFAQFDTVISVPPDIAPDSIGSNTQLNVFAGGHTPFNFEAGSPDGASVAVQVNVSGGYVDSRFRAYGGSSVNISGGYVRDHFDARAGSDVEILGNDFLLNGLPVAGLDMVGDSVGVDLPMSFSLTGVLSDGSVFAFSDLDSDRFATGALRLTATDLPPAAPGVFYASSDPLPFGVRAGQSLVVDAGSFAGNYYSAAPGSQVEVQVGGTVGFEFEAVGTVVDIVGGRVGSRLKAYAGTQVTMSGGAIGDGVRVLSGSTMKMIGNDFRIDGIPIAGLDVVGTSVSVTIPSKSMLTGVLADGMAFAMTPVDLDLFESGSLTLQSAELPVPTPGVFYATKGGVPPLGIRNGQTLIVDTSIASEYRAAPGSTLELHRFGSIGSVELVGAVANIVEGQIGRVDVAAGAVLNLSGGADLYFSAWGGGTVNIAEGYVPINSIAYDDSIINISGRSNQFSILPGIGLSLETGSVANFYGKQFLLDGEEIAGLTVGEPYVLSDRDGAFNGVLANDTTFYFPLTRTVGRNTLPQGGTIVLHLVPDDFLVGDFNADGHVNAADYTIWRNSVGESVAPGFGPDANFDGFIDRGDYYLWKNYYGRSVESPQVAIGIPEPDAFTLFLVVAVAGLMQLRFRRT